jgi:hypothetical protein
MDEGMRRNGDGDGDIVVMMEMTPNPPKSFVVSRNDAPVIFPSPDPFRR